ncbi:MAG TPA: sigma-54 dependent transcriptional regulator [Clostridia bacterium]|nr:sigma-54 dependent transcriptional regulator [Clostridia bacterium]
MTEDFRVQFLIVDDQQSIRKLCVTIGASLGFLCDEAESAEAALAFLETNSPDIILVDLRMAEMSGLEFLATVKKMLPRTEVAIMTGYGSIESAVQAMKLGAYDYITKPFRVEELKLTLQRMSEKVRLVAENEFLRERFKTETELHGIVGSSAKIQDVLRMVARLKDTRTPVLITGESGTGKELVARAIHFRGSFAKRPFVAVDCGSLVPTLIESELFGYEKGAFTGANRAKEGLFETANNGTIFLDEIGELPMEMQAKLLRVLQEKEIRPVGSNRNVKVDVRVIAATNRDLESSYKNGTFRKDLYFRLNVVTVHLPSLRERKSDIAMLLHWFLDRYSSDTQIAITNEAMKCLLQYDWPGNVRELENCIERAIALGNRKEIDIADLPPSIRSVQAAALESASGTQTFSSTDLEDIERITIQRVFDQVNGDKEMAGRLLGISRATLYRKIKRYNIQTKPRTMMSAAVSAGCA